MYALYIANKNYSSWSLRPWVLMRELAIAFRELLTPFEHGSSWTAFRQFSPTGKVPCLVDANRVVWDSLGITEYLAERHDGVWPVEADARAWSRCAAAEMHAGFNALRGLCPMNCGIRVELKETPDALARDLERLQELWREGLHRFGGCYLAGPTFTAVDAFFAPVAFRAQTYRLPLDPLAADYVSRLLALPSMQSWYADALLEPWREEGHEEEARTMARRFEDLRTGA